MNKRILALILTVILFLANGIYASAFTDESFSGQLEASGADKLCEYLSEETLEYMEKLGFDGLDFERILNVSPISVFKIVGEMIKDGFSVPLKGMMKATGAVLLISVLSGFFPDDEKSRSVLNIACGSFVIISVLSDAADAVRSAAAAIGACAEFEKALIPVLAAMLTAGGNPVSAISVKGAAFAAAQTVEWMASEFILPLIGISAALNVSGAVLPTLRISAVGDIIRKTATTVLGASAGLFSGFLCLKSVVTSRVDSLAVKGVKMASGTFIPIVGGALGEIYTTFSASVSLLKTTVGIYAITAFFVIGIPVIINLAMWSISMKSAAAISDLLDCRQCSEVLKNIGFVFSCVNTILIFCITVFTVTAGVCVMIKNGG